MEGDLKMKKKKLEYGDIVLWGQTKKGKNTRRNVIFWVGRKYAIICEEELFPEYTYRNIKIPIDELVITEEKYKFEEIK